MNFEQTIEQYIIRHGLMRLGGFYLVGLSGGADSVALLCVLRQLGYRIEAVHCNFHLRGDESLRDELFCVSLCEKMGIPLHRAHFDTKIFSRVHHLSIEMGARELRYGYFERLRRDMGADDICVAHHRDDQVETVLLNLIRGTGMDGLQGMKPRNGNVVRPMLAVPRSEVMRYLDIIKQDYVTDSSNLVNDVMRNKLRLDIIPQLELINPAARTNIFRMTENLREANSLVEAQLQADIASVRRGEMCYDLKGVHRLNSPLYTLWAILSMYGLNRSQTKEVLAHKGGVGVWTSKAYVAIAERGSLQILTKEDWQYKPSILRIPEEGVYLYSVGPTDGCELSFEDKKARIRVVHQVVNDDFRIERISTIATLDAARISFPLVVRPVKTGDRFVPFGMSGSKLISDFLTDNKVSAIDRRRQVVVEDGEGNIVWLVGRRIDQRYAIDGKRSEGAIVISLE